MPPVSESLATDAARLKIRVMGRINTVMSLARRLMRAFRALHIAAKHVGTTYPEIIRRAVRLFVKQGIAPDEALRCGLLDPRVPADAETGCISKRRLMAQQRRYNPSMWACLTEDKSVFYAYCASVGLAVPAMYAVFDVPNGWSSTGEILRERKDWEQFFEQGLPDEFIVKPAEGVYGHAVNAYTRTAGGFLDAAGVNRTASALYETLRGDARYRRFVIQERLRNHVDLERLSGTAAVQCARLVTWVRTDGDVEVYITFLKIIVGSSVTDNYEYGRSGNLKANISVEDGTLGPAIGGTPGGIGFRIVPTHPKTGITFLGFRLPYWHNAQQLVCRAARLFWPLRTIGWDVAFRLPTVLSSWRVMCGGTPPMIS